MVNSKNILITGSKGQLGSSFKKISKAYNYNFIFTDKSDLDITNFDLLVEFFENNKIDTLINCVAYTQVDKAETKKNICDKVNSEAISYLSRLCEKFNIQLVHISTDYVFDGKKDSAYNESDFTKPLNNYGLSKLQGEKIIMRYNLKNSIIIRTSLLYYDNGNSFVNKIINKIIKGDSIDVVNDQFSSPTYANDLSHAILKIVPLIRNNNTEIYHYSNKGNCSRYDLAIKINELINGDLKINPIKSQNNMTVRPLYTVLNTSKIINKFNLKPRHWEEALEEFISEQNIILYEI